MRVISGSLKGRVIQGFNIEGTRPTMDRVKESIFGSIQGSIQDSKVLDLFAGSGNLGIEAISNGCRHCTFVDCNLKCIELIRKMVLEFGIIEKSTLMVKDYRKALMLFKEKGQVFDVIFVDPPYKEHILIEILESVRDYGLLSKSGIIVLEYNQDDLEEEIEGYIMVKKKRYGDKYVSIYQGK